MALVFCFQKLGGHRIDCGIENLRVSTKCTNLVLIIPSQPLFPWEVSSPHKLIANQTLNSNTKKTTAIQLDHTDPRGKIQKTTNAINSFRLALANLI